MDRRLVGLIIGLFIFLGVFSFYAYVIAAGEAETDPTILALRDRDAQVREAAARLLASQQRITAIPALIEALDAEKETSTRTALADALRVLSKEAHGEDAAEWREWWERAGPTRLAAAQGKPADTAGIGAQVIGAYVGIVTCMIFLVFMGVVFAAMASSRIKEMKEMIRRAQEYISTMEAVARKAEDVKATILAEQRQAVQAIEAQTREAIAILKNDSTEELSEQSRFGEIWQQNAQHWAREMMMELRQKAERELQSQAVQTKAEEIREVKRAALEAEKKMEAERVAHGHWLAAQRHSARGRHAAVLKSALAMLEAKPGDAEGLVLQGTALRQLGRLEEALDISAKAMAAAPNEPEALYLRAAVLAALKRRDEMLAVLAQAVAADGEFKDEALNDSAFRDYWQDPQFKDLAES